MTDRPTDRRDTNLTRHVLFPSANRQAAGGIEQLIDRNLGDLYADYDRHTRTVLVRQARDVLVCTFYGDLQRFEREFLGPAAQMLRQVYGSYWRRHSGSGTTASECRDADNGQMVS